MNIEFHSSRLYSSILQDHGGFYKIVNLLRVNSYERNFERTETKKQVKVHSYISKGARRDREPSRLPWRKIMNLFNNNKGIKMYVSSHIVKSVPNSSALKKISSLIDYRIILKPEFVEVNQLQSLVQKLQGFILLLIMFMFSKQCEA